MEQRIFNVLDYVEANPEMADAVAQEMNLQSADQIPDHMYGQLLKYDLLDK
jgi:hypothetical protein